MQLRRDGFPALAIHGDKSQGERDWVLAEFKSGKSPIMLATDVAARGLGAPVCLLLLFECVEAAFTLPAPVWCCSRSGHLWAAARTATRRCWLADAHTMVCVSAHHRQALADALLPAAPALVSGMSYLVTLVVQMSRTSSSSSTTTCQTTPRTMYTASGALDVRAPLVRPSAFLRLKTQSWPRRWWASCRKPTSRCPRSSGSLQTRWAAVAVAVAGGATGVEVVGGMGVDPVGLVGVLGQIRCLSVVVGAGDVKTDAALSCVFFWYCCNNGACISGCRAPLARVPAPVTTLLSISRHYHQLHARRCRRQGCRGWCWRSRAACRADGGCGRPQSPSNPGRPLQRPFGPAAATPLGQCQNWAAVLSRMSWGRLPCCS